MAVFSVEVEAYYEPRVVKRVFIVEAEEEDEAQDIVMDNLHQRMEQTISPDDYSVKVLEGAAQ